MRGLSAASEPDKALSSRQVSHSERTQTERNGPSPSGPGVGIFPQEMITGLGDCGYFCTSQ